MNKLTKAFLFLSVLSSAQFASAKPCTIAVGGPDGPVPALLSAVTSSVRQTVSKAGLDANIIVVYGLRSAMDSSDYLISLHANYGSLYVQMLDANVGGLVFSNNYIPTSMSIVADQIAADVKEKIEQGRLAFCEKKESAQLESEQPKAEDSSSGSGLSGWPYKK